MFTVNVDTKRLAYSLTFHSRVSILCGDSGVGKSYLLELLSDYLQEPNLCVTVDTPLKMLIIGNNFEQDRLKVQSIDNALVFVEDTDYVVTEAFAFMVLQSSNYFVINTRDRLKRIPDSIKTFYTLTANKVSNKFLNTAHAV